MDGACVLLEEERRSRLAGSLAFVVYFQKVLNPAASDLHMLLLQARESKRIVAFTGAGQILSVL